MPYNELYHHGIKGQKWGVRRFQNEDGTYTSEGLKNRKKAYKEHIRSAKKEYRQVIKDSKKNKLLPNKQAQRDAIKKVDDYAFKKSKELYNEYKDLKLYKAKLNGKDTVYTFPKTYFRDIGLDPNILGLSYPTLNDYTVVSSGGFKYDKNDPYVQKTSFRYYQI